jgi:addiction module HigA family antidote
MFLAEVIEPRGYGAQSDIARRMGLPPARLNDICKTRRPVTPDVALLMAKVSGTSAQLWLHLQADYDLWHALKKTDTSNVQPLGPIKQP